MKDKSYDFKGWATKSNILVSDGVIIHSDAFAKNDGSQVPLVWNHQRNSPDNILGHVDLIQHGEGTYAYGHFNDSESAKAAKTALEHGDISAMSIGANHIKRIGNKVVGGNIFEVSLVVAGANPGALIEEVVTHSEEDGETAIVYNGLLIHSATDEEPDDKEPDMTTDTTGVDNTKAQEPTSMEDVFNGMTDEQLDAVNSLVEAITDGEEEGAQDMQHNAFSDAQGAQEPQDLLTHADLTNVLIAARDNGTTFKQALQDSGIIEHADEAGNSVSNISELFPEPHNQNTPPQQIVDPHTGTEQIIAGVSRSPFSRVKNMWTDLTDMTDEQARAKGYIKGSEKLDSVIKVAKRSTTPTLIYIKNKLDRQDIIDITDFNVVPWMQGILLQKLKQELARAILVGDGRTDTDKNKINDDNIRPILSDDDFYTLKVTTAGLASFVEDVKLNMGDLLGTGGKTLYINPKTLTRLTLMKDGVGSYLFGGNVPSEAALASVLGVSSVQATTFLAPGQVLVGNIADYQVGNTKGGEITNFDDFDIDFNQYKYLTETYLSGALINPKSFLAVTITDPITVPAFVIQNNQVNYKAPTA